MATAGALVALSSPVMADVGAEARSAPGQRVTYDAGRVPGHAAVTGWGRPVGDDDDVAGKGCWKRCHPGPPGPPGPRSLTFGVDTAFATPTGGTPTLYAGFVQGDGTTLVRDLTAVAPNPRWANISTLAGYPANVTDVSLAAVASTNQLVITVRTPTNLVAQTTCLVTINPIWPGICSAFVNLTPPL